MLSKSSRESLRNFGFRPPRPNRRILAVDDDSVHRFLVIRMLEGLGYEHVDAVENGALAVVAVQRRRYELVFMDLLMPAMDGMTAARRIRELPLSWPRPRVIALTAAEPAEDLFEAGVDGFIRKPADPEKLLAVLRGGGKVAPALPRREPLVDVFGLAVVG